MVTATPTLVDDFERYFERTKPSVPTAIRHGAPPPPTWIGSAEQWDALAELARQSYWYQAARDFCLGVANGWYPAELAVGKLQHGSSVAPGGQVVRPLPSTVSPDLERAAEQALTDLHRLNVGVDPVMELNLEYAAAGAWHGEPKAIAAAVNAARAAITKHQAEIEAAAQRERKKVLLRVRCNFRAIGGARFEPGDYWIDAEQAAELREWRSRMEAQATEHDWDAPVGFAPETWPPFAIVDTGLNVFPGGLL